MQNRLSANPLLPDIIAGLSIAGLLFPEAVAYARIANLPIVSGIVGLLIGLLVYRLLGQSRFAIVSATSSSSALLAASITSLGISDPAHRMTLAFALVLITGMLFILAALARLGKITDFIAKPVLRGFAFGLALMITIKQICAVAGIQPIHSDFPQIVWQLISHYHAWNHLNLLVSVLALMLLFGLQRWRRIPAALVVIALSAWGSGYFSGIPLVGTITLDFVRPTVPNLSFDEWLRLAELSVALTLIIYAESYGTIRTFAVKHGDTDQPNRDLLSLGIANLLSGIFRGIPVGAGYSATSANEAAGAVSKNAGAVAFIVTLIITATLLPVIARTPEAVLSAIVIHAVSHALHKDTITPYFIWHRDRLVLMTTISGVLMLGILDGLLVGIALSLILTLKRFSDKQLTPLGRLLNTHDFLPLSDDIKGVAAVVGIQILRPSEPIFFANVDAICHEVQSTLDAHPGDKMILSLEETPDLDSTAIEGLTALIRHCEINARILVLARLKEPVLGLLSKYQSQYVNLTALSVDAAVQKITNH